MADGVDNLWFCFSVSPRSEYAMPLLFPCQINVLSPYKCIFFVIYEYNINMKLHPVVVEIETLQLNILFSAWLSTVFFLRQVFTSLPLSIDTTTATTIIPYHHLSTNTTPPPPPPPTASPPPFHHHIQYHHYFTLLKLDNFFAKAQLQ